MARNRRPRERHNLTPEELAERTRNEQPRSAPPDGFLAPPVRLDAAAYDPRQVAASARANLGARFAYRRWRGRTSAGR